MTKKSFFIAAAVLLLIAGVIIGCMLLSGEKETRKKYLKDRSGRAAGKHKNRKLRL